MNIEELGEFGLIERIKRLLPSENGNVLLGIGDDVAIVRGNGPNVWLATCDVQMEGAHFLRNTVSPRDLGRKALAVNLSDIAATGGIPRYALISLGLPKDLPVEFIDELYAGLRFEAERSGTTIIGGNISRSRLGLFIDIFLLGEAQEGHILLRSGARTGDKIVVTGTLGDAAAGAALLLDPLLPATDAYAARARTRFNLPAARLKESGIIASSHAASAMIDISDGLAGDLQHICNRSGVGAIIYTDRLPVEKENRDLSKRVKGDELDFAVFGGEDYELLFTVAKEKAPSLAEKITAETGTPVSIIGEILPASDGRRLVLPDGMEIPLEARGWDHFKS
jgi:thiamine-monophosphate kinase